MTYKNGIREYLLLAVCYGVPMGIIFGLWQKSVLVGIISGAMCGILYGVIMFLFVKSQEKKFDKMREQIASERKIICDGGATLHGNGGWLFLTEEGLEFYPHKINFSTNFHKFLHFLPIKKHLLHYNYQEKINPV